MCIILWFSNFWVKCMYNFICSTFLNLLKFFEIRDFFEHPLLNLLNSLNLLTILLNVYRLLKAFVDQLLWIFCNFVEFSSLQLWIWFHIKNAKLWFLVRYSLSMDFGMFYCGASGHFRCRCASAGMFFNLKCFRKPLLGIQSELFCMLLQFFRYLNSFQFSNFLFLVAPSVA